MDFNNNGVFPEDQPVLECDEQEWLSWTVSVRDRIKTRPVLRASSKVLC